MPTIVSTPAARRATARERDVIGRALRRQTSRLRDRRRIAAILITSVSFAVIVTLLLARGETAGVDAQAYWAAARAWLAGGSPYEAGGPYLPYVYPPWMLPLFVPWALLPWDVAWFVWRVGTIVLLLWTYDWAYRRHPLRSSLILAALALPLAANLDTGNINLLLVLGLWAAQFSGPLMAGLLWALVTWMKWVPVVFLFVLAPRGRLYGLIGLAICGLLSLLMLPLTIVQLQVLFGFGPRPVRVDYLVLLWAVVPWWYRHPDPLWWFRPSSWPRLSDDLSTTFSSWSRLRLRLRRFLGLPA
ncbi:MAG TPA: glycosyltransferase family 87 protein [Candidatus Limnocylindrales bacterium]|nr:glycosyltransferase family 87 protein [Candidatus Limnocylindrales bacterium]